MSPQKDSPSPPEQPQRTTGTITVTTSTPDHRISFDDVLAGDPAIPSDTEPLTPQTLEAVYRQQLLHRRNRWERYLIHPDTYEQLRQFHENSFVNTPADRLPINLGRIQAQYHCTYCDTDFWVTEKPKYLNVCSKCEWKEELDMSDKAEFDRIIF